MNSVPAVSASQSSLYTPYRQGTGLVQPRRLCPAVKIARSDYETSMSTWSRWTYLLDTQYGGWVK